MFIYFNIQKMLKNLALLCLVCFVFNISAGINKNSKKVHLRYTSQWFTDHLMPDQINITLTGIRTLVKLHLSRITHIVQDLPVYTLSVNNTGLLVHTKEEVANVYNDAYYQDLENQAVIHVTEQDTLPSGQRLKFKGQFVLDGSKYAIDSESSQERDSISFIDGYILRQESGSQHENSGWMTNNGNTNKLFRLRQHLHYAQTAASSESSGRQHHRKRREAPPSYYIDTVAVVDYKAYQRFHDEAGNKSLAFQNLKEYYRLILCGVDLLYQTIRNADFQIRVRLIKIVVAETAESSNFTEQFQEPDSPLHTVDDDLVLSALKEYVGGQGGEVVTPSDHVMLFTGYDMVKRMPEFVTKKSAGRAYQATLCQGDGYSTSVIEDTQGFGCISIAAHELGHSFSANHDGEGNECNSSDRYIMSTISLPSTPTTRLNPWRFSECSERSIAAFVTSLLGTSHGAKCLKESLPAEEYAFIPGLELPGLKYSADHQCRMIHGNHSFLCPRIEPYDLLVDPASICTEMYCYHPGEETCYSAVAVQGTVCGSGKLCISGECVSHNSAPELNETCMFGDDPFGKINGMNCSRLISQHPSFCYDAEIVTTCCASCKAIYRHEEGCEYGDHAAGCSDSNCGEGSRGRNLCCGTCAHHEGATDSLSPASQNGVCMDNPTASINGVTCPEAIRSNPAFCYIANVQKQCCQSCAAAHTSVAGCEYGDQVTGCEDSHCYEGLPTLQDCCSTCNYSASSAAGEADTTDLSMQVSLENAAGSSESSSATEPPPVTAPFTDASTTSSGSSKTMVGFLSSLETTRAQSISKDSTETTVKSSSSSGFKDPILPILNAISSTENLLTPLPTHSMETTPSTHTPSSTAPARQATTPIATRPATNPNTPPPTRVAAPASTTSQDAQVRRYVSQQRQQLEQHLEQQQAVLERLLRNDLLHQEFTLPHHQVHLKLLLRHYLQHQKHLLEHHLQQQRALLQEHLRNQARLETLCKN